MITDPENYLKICGEIVSLKRVGNAVFDAITYGDPHFHYSVIAYDGNNTADIVSSNGHEYVIMQKGAGDDRKIILFTDDPAASRHVWSAMESRRMAPLFMQALTLETAAFTGIPRLATGKIDKKRLAMMTPA